MDAVFHGPPFRTLLSNPKFQYSYLLLAAAPHTAADEDAWAIRSVVFEANTVGVGFSPVAAADFPVRNEAAFGGESPISVRTNALKQSLSSIALKHRSPSKASASRRTFRTLKERSVFQRWNTPNQAIEVLQENMQAS